MDIQQQIFGLLGAAEDQQKSVKAALDGLNAERTRLALVTTKLENSLPALRNATQEAVSAAVGASVSGAAKAAVGAFEGASAGLVDRLSEVATAAEKAEAGLNNAISSFRWKWVLLALGLIMLGMSAVLGFTWLLSEWNQYEIASLKEERQALVADVAMLKGNVAALEKRGGRIAMTTCGKRLCIEASSNTIEWWTDDSRKIPLVIPHGY